MKIYKRGEIMTVSVIVPVYQAQDYLASCLDSILAQTFSDFEVVCVNDGSYDDSVFILSEYAKKDRRIHVINQENKGVSAARNIALKQAQGDFITFLDSDDMWHPCYLEYMMKALYDTQADFVFCNYHTISSDQKKPDMNLLNTVDLKITDSPFDDLIFRRYNFTVMVWGKIFRRSVLSQLYFDERIDCGEDYIFTHKAVYKSKLAVALNENLIFYRTGNPSLMRSAFSDKKVQDHLLMATILQDYFYGLPMKDETRKKLLHQIAKIFLKYAMIYPMRYNINDCYQYWKKYAEQLKEYHQKGIYCPIHLSMKNRLLSWMFLHQNFYLLKLIKGN